MEFKALVKYLFDAEGKSQESLAKENPYRLIAFDGTSPRLGWTRQIPFSAIEGSLNEAAPFLDNITDVVFLGIGGSGNGIKSLRALFKSARIYAVDSLDPSALEDVVSRVKDINTTLVVPISKSGTTKETQLLALAFKELLGSGWQKRFLWMADNSAFSKLDAQGWTGVKKVSIQCDGQDDIGGRFSCPHTLIFFLPLFILLGKDIKKLQKLYNSYLTLLRGLREEAYALAHKYREANPAYFVPLSDGALGDEFFAWVVQLLQESLGAKNKDFSIKTLQALDGRPPELLPVKSNAAIKDPVVGLMANMYFFQMFTAFCAAFKNINFVNQEMVEKYKAQMRKLEGEKPDARPQMKIDQVADEVKKQLNPGHRFIETVLYFYPHAGLIDNVRKTLSRAFPDRRVLVFVGSDWNHHSYQAAAGDKETFFIFLNAASYKEKAAGICADTLKKNSDTLRLISKATYLTMSDKSVLLDLVM